jgi:uncharacterized protein YndB with AHSA1/START domain
VFFTRSADGGTTWTGAVRVGWGGATNDQWMPTMAVRPDENVLFIGWYDRRNDANNSLIDVYGCWGSIATNGTVSLPTNDFRITTTSFPPAFAGTDPTNIVAGHYDPVWPPKDVSLSWWYTNWWDPFAVTSDAYIHMACEHNGACADMNHVYLVWSDHRSTSQATTNAARYQADVRLARLPWPHQ